MASRSISTAQMKMLYGLAKKCGLDNETLHDRVRAMTGQESIKALTSYQASKVIDRLKRMCGQEPAQPPDRATQAQRVKIQELVTLLGWADEPARLRGLLRKLYRASDVAFLNAKKTEALIETLKAMVKGGRGERGGNDGKRQEVVR